MGVAKGGRRRSWRVAMIAGIVLGVAPLSAASALAAEDPASHMRADLDGKALALEQVGQWYCHDFDYPVIHCFSTARALQTAVQPILATSSVTYAIGYDFTSFQGPFMYFSQDYTVLATIGWNDRISSLAGSNGQSSAWWTDWFYGGSRFNLCCDSGYTSLGSYNNAFSSVFLV